MSHDQTQGDLEDGRSDESHHHPVDAVEDIRGETEIGKEIPTRLKNPSRRGKEQGVDQSSISQD